MTLGFPLRRASKTKTDPRVGGAHGRSPTGVPSGNHVKCVAIAVHQQEWGLFQPARA